MNPMEPRDYTVVSIEGEYAYLREVRDPFQAPAAPEDDLFIALALLPPGVDVGMRLHYEMLTYCVVEE